MDNYYIFMNKDAVNEVNNWNYRRTTFLHLKNQRRSLQIMVRERLGEIRSESTINLTNRLTF